MRLSVIFLTCKANAGVQPTGYLPSPQSRRSQQSDCALGCKCLRRTRKKKNILGSSPRNHPTKITLPPLPRHTITSSTGTQCDHVGLSKVPIFVTVFQHKNCISSTAMCSVQGKTKQAPSAHLIGGGSIPGTWEFHSCGTGALYRPQFRDQQSI